MRALAVFLAVWLAMAGVAAAAAQTGTPPSGATASDNPALVDGRYQLPPAGTVVVRALVDAGPLPPAFQQGYEVRIDASGTASVVVTPEGASPALATPTATQRTYEVELGPDGLQALLADLDDLGLFALTPPAAPLPTRMGGPTRFVAVTLADGTWTADNHDLPEADWERLEAGLDAIAAAVGLAPDGTPLASATPQTAGEP